MRGLTISTNAMGFTAVRLHYSCDPFKDPDNTDTAIAAEAQKWLEIQKLQFPDPNDFQREMEINFFVGKGSRVFPQFSQVYHTMPTVFNRHKVIYRTWDFGYHAPACLFAQIDAQGRLHLIRELVGRNQITHDFAQRVVKLCEDWYPLHAAGYEDYCDPAGQQVKSLESDKNEKRDIEVLSGLGINANYEYGWSRKDGRTLVHRLLAMRTDGTPGLRVDESTCPTLTQSFLGRYVFPETRDGRIKEEPDDDTHPWADVMAALRYLVIGLHRKLGLSRIQFGITPATLAPVDYHGYGSPWRG